MTRRGFIAPLIGAVVAGCSPLSLLNTLGPRDGGARRVARDLRYGDDPRQQFDLFAPTAPPPAGGWPTVVFFYGNGWVPGDKAQYAWVGQAVASQGFLVAVADYRGVPEAVFPTFIEDAAAAVARVHDVAADHGGDPERLGVMGHSAGAHLTMMITLDRRYLDAVGRPGIVKAAVGLAGPYEFLPFNVPASINAFGRAPDPTLTQPVTFVRADAPPLWLGHGTADPVVHDEDTVILCDRMQAVGGRCEKVLYAGLNHEDLIAVFSPLFRKKAPVMRDAVAFLHRELG